MGTVESDRILVNFDGKKCIHARRCVLGLPEVFNPGAKGQWIFPEHADAKDIASVVRDCPSGALTYQVKDKAETENLPRVNTARLWENGPTEYRGDLKIDGQEPRQRAVLCRCGQSKNKPFCDNSHLDAGFVATSVVAPKDEPVALEARDGELTLKPLKDGPLMVSGNLEVVAGSGRKITSGKRFAMCRCGASKNKPFCDGSHKEIGFEAD